MSEEIEIESILIDFDKISREKIRHYSLSFKEYLQTLRESPGLLI